MVLITVSPEDFPMGSSHVEQKWCAIASKLKAIQTENNVGVWIKMEMLEPNNSGV
jgi:hypothetical protein